MPLFLAYLSLIRLAGVPQVCAAPAAGGNGVQLFVEAVKASPRDTVLIARLCLVPPKAGVGSYQATLSFDSTVMRVLRVEVSGGMQAKNLAIPGVIKLAGAAPVGFPRGPLATIAFKPSPGHSLGKIRVALVEANSIKGTTLLAGAMVRGYPASDRTLGVIEAKPTKPGTSLQHPSPSVAMATVPHVDSIAPGSGRIEPESVVEVTLYGRGFADGNVVLFDAARVEKPVAEDGGTILKFIVPTMIPAHGTVQLHRVEPGQFLVKVQSAAGTSNAVMFTVRGEDR